MALLHLAADWAKARGRRLLALTVDHNLNAMSADWTRFAGVAARALGAEWRALSWDEAAPGPGLTARARAARHGLIAEAARTAGAKVVLLAFLMPQAGGSRRRLRRLPQRWWQLAAAVPIAAGCAFWFWKSMP